MSISQSAIAATSVIKQVFFLCFFPFFATMYTKNLGSVNHSNSSRAGMHIEIVYCELTTFGIIFYRLAHDQLVCIVLYFLYGLSVMQ